MNRIGHLSDDFHTLFSVELSQNARYNATEIVVHWDKRYSVVIGGKTVKSVAIFNNKGGVGKTTVLCNLAGYLCQKMDKKVLVIDADPQCNTTTYVLDADSFLQVYYEPGQFTLNDIVLPLKTRGSYIEPERINILHSNGFGFDVIAGSPKLATSEDFLSGDWKDIKAGEIRGIRSNMIFFDLLRKCNIYDYVFFDMGPSLGAINRAILLACDFFITPMSSDLFSILALENISSSISDWMQKFNDTVGGLSPEDQVGLEGMDATCGIKFLGYIYQQYITRTSDGNKRIVRAYEEILKQLPEKINQYMIEGINHDCSKEINYEIGSIPNFYSLIPMSQSSHKSVFTLTSADGVVGAHYQKVKEYEDIIQQIAQNMCANMEALV